MRKKLSFDDKFSQTFCPEILRDLGAVNVNKLAMMRHRDVKRSDACCVDDDDDDHHDSNVDDDDADDDADDNDDNDADDDDNNDDDSDGNPKLSLWPWRFYLVSIRKLIQSFFINSFFKRQLGRSQLHRVNAMA